MREYDDLAAATGAAVAGEFGCGTVVSIGGARHQLTSMDGEHVRWLPLREASIVPPLRKFASVDDVRKAVRCGGLQIDDPVEVGGNGAHLAWQDGAEFALVWLDGRQTAHALHECVGGDPAPEPAPPPRTRTLPDDDAERKAIPLYAGCLLYFPAALVEVAKCSRRGNDQHNPGQPLHWARGKSMAQMESQLHHMLDQAESTGAERIEHLASNAWRALAELQLECERQGAPRAPNAKDPTDD